MEVGRQIAQATGCKMPMRRYGDGPGRKRLRPGGIVAGSAPRSRQASRNGFFSTSAVSVFGGLLRTRGVDKRVSASRISALRRQAIIPVAEKKLLIKLATP